MRACKVRFDREGSKSGAEWKLVVTMEVNLFGSNKREET